MFRKNLQIFFLFLAVVLVLILFKESRIFDLGFIIRRLANPQKIANQLVAPPDDLNEQYQNVLSENAQLQALKQENEMLRDFFDFVQEKNFQLRAANIISRDDINQNLLLIDVGQTAGVQVGQAVVINQGIMIGKVIEVRMDASVIRLLTDNQSRLAVAVGDQQLVSGMLTGALGLSMDLSFIPQEQEIKKGDLVVTNNLNKNIAPGLIVGQIEEVKFSEEELFKNASVSTLVDYGSLFLVGVLINE